MGVDILNLVDDLLMEAGLDSKGLTHTQDTMNCNILPFDFLQHPQQQQHTQPMYSILPEEQYQDKWQQSHPLWQGAEVLTSVVHQTKRVMSGTKRSFNYDQQPSSPGSGLSSTFSHGCQRHLLASSMRPTKLNRVQMSYQDLSEIAATS